MSAATSGTLASWISLRSCGLVAEIKGLVGAKVLKLTLLPADGTQLPYEFDVAGAPDAIKGVGCKGNAQVAE
jgi:hypothetical protein